jgi:hypothetical protein
MKSLPKELAWDMSRVFKWVYFISHRLPNNTVCVNYTKSLFVPLNAMQRAMMTALGLAGTPKASLSPMLTPV